MPSLPDELLLIDGRARPAAAGAWIPIQNPATGAPLARVAQGGPEDIDAAVAAAGRAFGAGAWRGASSRERSAALLDLARRIREQAENLATLETQQVGKPIADSRDEVEACARCFEYYAGQIASFGGETVPVAARGTALTFREPVGVCALIVPWNFPLLIAAWKVAPALAMGNAAVVKPAPATPLTALRLGELALEAGIPPGVLHIVPGDDDAGAALVGHPGVRKISFTGSSAVGQEIYRRAADGFKRISLELGGKSASLVFADADLEKAASSVFSAYGNAGQDCCCRSRILVERPVYSEFVERWVERARAIRIGDPLDPATEFGSLISPAHRERVDGLVRSGSEAGASLCLGGKPPAGGIFEAGAFYEPTVFKDARPGMRIVEEEIFGPVVAMIPFETEEEAVRIANATTYGLSGSVWTRDIGRALRVARAMETGVLSINSSSSVHVEMPFGGVKASGLGRDLGRAALEHYSELKSVFIAAE